MYNKTFFFSAVCLAGMLLMIAAFFTSQAVAQAGADDAGRGVFFKEHAELIVKIPENARIIAPSVRPFPDIGKVAYVIDDDNGFKVCMNNECGPYVNAVARGMPVVSPDRGHWAAIVQKDGKSRVMLNGAMGRGYDRVASLGFSPDSMKVAYIAAEGDAFFVCVNQDRHPSFSLIDPEQGLVFSSDSNYLAYAARTDRNAWCVVRNGVPGAAWEEIRYLTFSPDGKRLAYAARRNDQWHVVEGENASPGYRTVYRVVFSPDSKSMAYIARSKEGAFAVINGEKQMVFDSVAGELLFSSDSRRLAYSVTEKTRLGENRMRMVVDGKPGNPFDAIGAYLFSMDGKRYAYVAQKDDGQMIVQGDVEHDLYDAIGIPMFDRGGRHLAYQAQKGSKWHIVKDRQAGPAFDMVTHPVFSFGGDRMAYLATKETSYVVVADGRVLGEYQWAGDLVFSPDDKHLAYGAARAGESVPMEPFLAIDGREGKERFFGFLNNCPLVFMDHRTVQGIALRNEGREFWLIRATIDEEIKK